MVDTIFALSSGAPPAAIAVIRISGPLAGEALVCLAGRLPEPRRASLRRLTRPDNGLPLDDALLLWFPGAATATGEDLAELHLHGGRAVVAAVEAALSSIAGLRRAAPGEFTRRSFDNGRIDLAEAEGLADLLSAETELQRRQALAAAGGALGREVAGWQQRLLALSAAVEAQLDFADEDDVAIDGAALATIGAARDILAAELRDWLARPTRERLGAGISVVIAGPPNAGKSTLLNALAERDIAIVAPIAGTTRDAIEVTLSLDGLPFRFVDTAGLHGGTGDAIEAIGMARAQAWIDRADILLWLAPEMPPPHPHCLRLRTKVEVASEPVWPADLHVSAITGAGMAELHAALARLARSIVPVDEELLLNDRQRSAVAAVAAYLAEPVPADPLILAEQLRSALAALDRVTGAAGTEVMLDALFGRFCIGK